MGEGGGKRSCCAPGVPRWPGPGRLSLALQATQWGQAAQALPQLKSSSQEGTPTPTPPPQGSLFSGRKKGRPCLHAEHLWC